MVATSVSINFRHIFDPIPDSLTMQDVYEVPASKVARIHFNYIHVMLDLDTNGNGNTYAFDQFFYIGDLEIHLPFISGTLAQDLEGRSFETSNLKAGCAFWNIEDEFIEPREDDLRVKGASSSEIFSRSSVGVGDALLAPRTLPRSWTLPTAKKVQFGATKSTALTMTTQRLIVDISAEVVLEDA